MNASTMSKKRKLEYHPGRSSNHPSSLTVVTVLDQVTNQKNVKTLQKKKNDGVFGSDLNLPAPPPIEVKVDVDMPLRVQTTPPPHGAVESDIYSPSPLMEVKVDVDMPLRAQTASPPHHASPAEKKRKVAVYGRGGETIDSETGIAHVSEGSKGLVVSAGSREIAADDEIIDDEHFSTILFLRRTEDGKFLPMKKGHDTAKSEMLQRAYKKTVAFVSLPNRCEQQVIHPVKLFDCVRKYGALTLVRRRLGMHLIDILDEVLGDDFKVAKSFTEQVRHFI